MSFYQKKNYHNETLKPLDIVATLFAQNDLDGSNFLLFWATRLMGAITSKHS